MHLDTLDICSTSTHVYVQQIKYVRCVVYIQMHLDTLTTLATTTHVYVQQIKYARCVYILMHLETLDPSEATPFKNKKTKSFTYNTNDTHFTK